MNWEERRSDRAVPGVAGIRRNRRARAAGRAAHRPVVAVHDGRGDRARIRRAPPIPRSRLSSATSPKRTARGSASPVRRARPPWKSDSKRWASARRRRSRAAVHVHRDGQRADADRRAAVFCDIEPDTWNLDPKRLEEAITPKTRAIVPVHFAGLAADMASILAIAEPSRHPGVRGRGAWTRRVVERPRARLDRSGRHVQLPGVEEHDRGRGRPDHHRRPRLSPSFAIPISGAAARSAGPGTSTTASAGTTG